MIKFDSYRSYNIQKLVTKGKKPKKVGKHQICFLKKFNGILTFGGKMENFEEGEDCTNQMFFLHLSTSSWQQIILETKIAPRSDFCVKNFSKN